MEMTIVDSVATIVALLDCIEGLPVEPPSLYLDIEGVNLSRLGSISIIQLFVEPKAHVFLIDIHVLQGQAFDTPNELGTTLRSVLESDIVPKAFFDVRNDADALFAHFQVLMKDVHDVQLLEVATRTFTKKHLVGLSRCIEKDTGLTAEARDTWKATKEAGLALFAPERGGTYEVFNQRPMQKEIIDYCTQDVLYLPILWNIYSSKISVTWAARAQEETVQRLLKSQSVNYDPAGKGKGLSPWGHEGKQTQSYGSKNKGKTGRKPSKSSHLSHLERFGVAFVAEKPEKQQVGLLPLQPPDLHSSTQAPEETVSLKKIRKAVNVQEDLAPATMMANLSSRAKSATQPLVTPKVLIPAVKWTCTICNREMKPNSMADHLMGKAHLKRLKKAPYSMPERDHSPWAAHVNDERTQKASTPPVTSIGTMVKSKAKLQTRGPLRSGGVAVEDNYPLGRVGAVYPPEHGFIGFNGTFAPRSYEEVRESHWGNGNYGLGDEDYSICDKDCGWCGHCFDGIDIDI